MWDFLTHSLNVLVKPTPILQVINLILGLFLFLLEWPLPWLAGVRIQRSLEFRLAFIPLPSLAASLLYQGTNAAFYYLIGLAVYFWAFSEGEVSWRAASVMSLLVQQLVFARTKLD
jgi:hypothetical protein